MLSNIPYSPYDYAAHLDRLADEVCWCRQQVRDMTGRRDVLGCATGKSGRPIGECIAAWEERLARAEAAYDRAKGEA